MCSWSDCDSLKDETVIVFIATYFWYSVSLCVSTPSPPPPLSLCDTEDLFNGLSVFGVFMRASARMCVCVCVCVCERERERGGGRQREIETETQRETETERVPFSYANVIQRCDFLSFFPSFFLLLMWSSEMCLSVQGMTTTFFSPLAL